MQAKTDSLWESVEGALIAAPTSILLHKIMLMIADQHALNENQDYFIMISWFFFILHSIAWRYFTRRVHTRYGFNIRPLNIYRVIKSKIGGLFD